MSDLSPKETPDTFELADRLESQVLGPEHQDTPRTPFFSASQYVHHSLPDQSSYLAPGAPELRRLDIAFYTEEIRELYREYLEGLKYGSPLSRCQKTFKTFKAKNRRVIASYRRAMLQEHAMENFDDASPREIEICATAYGYSHGKDAKEAFMASNSHLSVGRKRVRIERICHSLAEKTFSSIETRILPRVCNLLGITYLPRARLGYGWPFILLKEFFANLFIGLAIGCPIVGVYFIPHMKEKLISIVCAIILDSILVRYFLELRYSHVCLLCASLAALYVVSISNDQSKMGLRYL